MYQDHRPNAVARNLNRAWAYLAAKGWTPRRMVTLEVPGRKTGRPIELPVVVADYEGERYLVSMLGEGTNWVRNVRAAGGRAALRYGGREEVQLEEVDPTARAAILRRYLELAPGARSHIPVDRHAPIEELEPVAERTPVFLIRRLGPSMKAIVQDDYGEVDVLDLRDVPTPTVGDDDVLIRVHAAGIEPGVWHLMTGRPYLVRIMARGLRDEVRGMDVAGTVEAVGRAVTDVAVGDEVFGTCHGSFAELARAARDTVAPKPSNLSFEQAAVVPVSGCTALQGLRDQGGLQAGQKVLIIGAGGGVGTFAVQIAKAFGAQVTGVCGTGNTELVRSLGADVVIDYTQEDVTEGAERFDLILDTAGRRPLAQLRRVLAPHGALVIVGGEGGGKWLGGFDRGFRGQLTEPLTHQRIRQLTANVTREDLLVLKDLIEDGQVTPVIDRTFPLAEVPDAIRHWEAGHAHGKVAISV
jgi:deazaflavin-dependent oxidoreductase (nitroreductase family)